MATEMSVIIPGPRSEFLDKPSEERPAAVPKHRGRQTEQRVQVARKMDGVSEPDQGLEHRREDENRHGQGQ